MNSWLDSFAYRIELGADVLFVTAAGSLAVALLTVGYQAYRATRLNPTALLRDD